MGTNNKGPCFIIIGIVLIVLGFIFRGGLWLLAIIGGFFIIFGIYSIAQKSKEASSIQPSTQQQIIGQNNQQKAPHQTKEKEIIEQSPQTPPFCPLCGAPAAGSFCSNCGSQID
ncbi:MAG: hypothetical protein ACFFAN_06445 [Promethearchaeota archaeon]